MKRTIISAVATLMAGTAYALDGGPTQIDADVNFSAAVKTIVRMDMCEGGRLDSQWLLRKYAIEEAAEISARDINEILVEAKGAANMITAAAHRKGIADRYCDPLAASSSLYPRLRLAAQASDLTKETLATLDRMIDERQKTSVALDLCDMSDADKVTSLEFIQDSRKWSYDASGICWRGQCRNNDQQLRDALTAISDKQAVCSKHAEFLGELPEHPIYKYRYENMVSSK